jgi:hypothetical protein
VPGFINATKDFIGIGAEPLKQELVVDEGCRLCSLQILIERDRALGHRHRELASQNHAANDE